jgi:hypothetical protein
VWSSGEVTGNGIKNSEKGFDNLEVKEDLLCKETLETALKGLKK